MKVLDIIYEDDYILVINKPAGLAVQGGKGVKVSVDSLLSHLDRASAPLLVHRLDKDTSGALLTAKGRQEAARFSRFLNEKKTSKKYIAVCAGIPEKNEGIIKDELLIHGNLKKSETKYKVLESQTEPLECSILEIELETGRMHQIRRHLAMHGNPVLGDDKYGDFKLNRELKKNIKLKHLLLHAARLTIKGEYNLDIKAPLPEYFKKFDVTGKLKNYYESSTQP